MADKEVCVFCDKLLSTDAVSEVKTKGLEKIRKCSERRKDGKDALFLGLESLKVHTNCWKKYTNEKSVNFAERNASRPNPAPINVPVDAIPQVPGVSFSFGDDYFFCGEEISEDFKKSEKKKSVDKRIVISTVTRKHTKQSIMKAAEKYPNDWTTQVNSPNPNHVEDQNDRSRKRTFSESNDTVTTHIENNEPRVTPLKKKKIRKTHKQKIFLQETLRTLSEKDDEYETFGKYVGSELRSLTNNILRKRMKRKIQEVIVAIQEEDEQFYLSKFFPYNRDSATRHSEL